MYTHIDLKETCKKNKTIFTLWHQWFVVVNPAAVEYLITLETNDIQYGIHLFSARHGLLSSRAVILLSSDGKQGQRHRQLITLYLIADCAVVNHAMI